jgi:hypothetical protein
MDAKIEVLFDTSSANVGMPKSIPLNTIATPLPNKDLRK